MQFGIWLMFDCIYQLIIFLQVKFNWTLVFGVL